MRAGLGALYLESVDSFAEASLLGRVCQPEDVAAAILSLIALAQETAPPHTAKVVGITSCALGWRWPG